MANPRPDVAHPLPWHATRKALAPITYKTRTMKGVIRGLRGSPILAALGIALLLLSSSARAAGNTIHVPADQPTIQAAINAAANGDTVLVAPGTYAENIDFKGKAITIKSVNGAATTVIDGGHNGSVVTFSTQEGPGSVLDGFTVRNGTAQFEGSGITIQNSSPTVINNTIINNGGCDGLGIAIGFGSPLIQKNTISNNQRTGCSGGIGGGGISIRGASNAQILDNVISNNLIFAGEGGGISMFSAGSPTIRGNLISGNSVSGLIPAAQGGGIVMANESDALIIDNVITGNTADLGGGIAALVPSGALGPLMLNNTITNNKAVQGGSEILVDGFDAQTQLINNVIVGNGADSSVFCGNFTNQTPVFKFNDVLNTPAAAYAGLCADQTGQNGNISADPQFVNAAGGDFHLKAASPAIDAGDTTAPDLPAQDFDGKDRILSGKGNCNAVVDLGAFEFGHASALSFSALSLSFANQLVGTTSSSQAVTVTNPGNTAVTVCKITASGDYIQTNTCGSSLAAGGMCGLNLAFAPSGRGIRDGFVQLISSDGGSPQFVLLSGKGVAPVASLSIAILGFGPQLVGTTSAPQVVTLSNTGDAPLAVSSIAASGDFGQSNTCGSSLDPGLNCNLNITFAPTAAGIRNGDVTVTDSAPGSPRKITLTGTGTDFLLGAVAGGATTATVNAGETAHYNLQIAPDGFTGMVALACSGAPATTDCTVSSPSLNLDDPVTPKPFSVSVSTMARSMMLPPTGMPIAPTPLRVPVIQLISLTIVLLLMALGLSTTRNERKVCVTAVGATILFLAVLTNGCNGTNTNPMTGTPKGTYTLTVTGTANGVHRTLTLTLIVK
jgi:parallel beta-helix repeat protein